MKPKEPFRLTGEYDNRGWDIPTEFCVDADGCCFMKMAHGDAVRPVSCQALLEDIEKEGDEDTANKVRLAIGQPLEEPLWARTARKHGWTPP
jgi:hypothetical protein